MRGHDQRPDGRVALHDRDQPAIGPDQQGVAEQQIDVGMGIEVVLDETQGAGKYCSSQLRYATTSPRACRRPLFTASYIPRSGSTSGRTV